MAGRIDRKSGKRKRHSSVLSKLEESPQESSTCSSTIPEEIPTLQSPSNIENEGLATSCKRVKFNRHEREISNELNIIHSDSESSGARSSSPRLHTLTISSESVKTDDSVRQREGVLGKLTDLGKKVVETVTPTSFLERYNRSSTSLPDYGGFDFSATTITMPPDVQRTRPVIPGGHQPRNTLGAGKATVPCSRWGQKVEPERKKKAFNILADEYNPESDHVFKKQKIDGRKVSSVIDVDGVEGRSITMTSHSSAGSRTAKSVQSLSSTPRPPMASTSLGHVEEYNGIEKRMSYTPATKRNRSFEHVGNEKKQVQAAASEAEKVSQIADYDYIDDSDPEASSGYKGNAFRAPPRPKSTFPWSTRRNSSRGISTDDLQRSPYFTTSKGAASDAVLAPFSKVVRDGYDTAQFPDRSLRNSYGSVQSLPSEDDAIEIDDDSVDQIQPQPKPAVQMDEKPNVMKSFARQKPDSLSTIGDIQSSAIRKTRRSTGDKPFLLAHFQTLSVLWTKEDQPQQFRLHVDRQQKEFYLLEDGVDVLTKNQSLLIRAEKALRIFYWPNSPVIIIHNSRDHGVDSAVKILLVFDNTAERERFMTTFQTLNLSVRAEERDNIDKIFARQTKDLTIEMPGKPPVEKPADIQLLEAREQKNGLTSAGQINVRHAANTSRRRQHDVIIDSLPISDLNRRTVAQRMNARSSLETSTNSNAVEIDLEDTNVVGPRTFRRPNVEDSIEIHYKTRSAAANRQAEHHASIAVSAPSRWTVQHPGWDVLWKTDPFLFPVNGKNQSRVDCRDIERLDEGEFLNDNLISFYLRFLERMVELQTPHLAGRVLFMNTFFYHKLTKGAGRQSIDYDAVKRWTAKVKLFEYDYIVVPINENTHWYLAIICNTPKLLPQKLNEMNSETLRDPVSASIEPSSPLPNPTGAAIVPWSESASPDLRLEQMSLEDRRADSSVEFGADWPPEDLSEGVQNRFSFAINSVSKLGDGLWDSEILQSTSEANSDSPAEEMEQKASNVKTGKRKSFGGRKYDTKEPRIITLDSLSTSHSKTCSNLKEYLISEAMDKLNITISPGALGMTAKDIPTQTNYCDCGVYLLIYVERFLKNPDTFVHRILKGEMHLVSGWPSASHTRNKIRRQIIGLQDHDGEGQDMIMQVIGGSKPPIDGLRSHSPTVEAEDVSHESLEVEGGSNLNRELNDPRAKTTKALGHAGFGSTHQLGHQKNKSAPQVDATTIICQQESQHFNRKQNDSSNAALREISKTGISRPREYSPNIHASGSSPPRHTTQRHGRSGSVVILDSEDENPQNQAKLARNIRSGSPNNGKEALQVKDSELEGSSIVVASSPIQAAPVEHIEDMRTESNYQRPSTPPRKPRRRSSSSPLTPKGKTTPTSMVLRSSPRLLRDTVITLQSRDEREKNGTWGRY